MSAQEATVPDHGSLLAAAADAVVVFVVLTVVAIVLFFLVCLLFFEFSYLVALAEPSASDCLPLVFLSAETAPLPRHACSVLAH